MSRIPFISVEYARVTLTADVTLDSQTVELAFMSTRQAEPTSGDWKTATWLTPVGKIRKAGVLVGPGELELAKGIWFVWFRLSDTPEVPAHYAGEVLIT